MAKRLLLTLAAALLALGALGAAHAEGPAPSTVVIDGVTLGVPPGYGGMPVPFGDDGVLGVPPGLGSGPGFVVGCVDFAIPAGFGGGVQVVCQ